MKKKRTNIYLTSKQRELLDKIKEIEGLQAMAEVVRIAIDEYINSYFNRSSTKMYLEKKESNSEE